MSRRPARRPTRAEHGDESTGFCGRLDPVLGREAAGEFLTGTHGPDPVSGPVQK